MSAVISFVSLCALLVIGKVLRVRIPLLQRLYLPSSVIGGVVGLVIFSGWGDCLPPEIKSTAAKCPGFLINVILPRSS